jgi:hypothetical protein
MLGPRTHRRVLDGAALLVAGADQVLASGMDAGLGSHATHDGDLVRLLGEVHHGAAELEVGLGLDRCHGALRFAFLRIKRVDVRHAADHLQEDQVLGLAKAGTGGG